MDYFVLRFDHSYRKEDILALSRLSSRIMRKWRSRIMRIFCTVLGMGILGSGVAVLTLPGMTLNGIVWILLGVILLLVSVFYNRINAWGTRKQTLQVENLTIKFSDEGLAQSSSKAAPTGAHQYSQHMAIIVIENR